MLFFSNKLLNESRYEVLISDLEEKVNTYKLDTTSIDETRDIWLKDFMPIQVGEKFIQYRYDPDYLKKSPHLRTDPEPICRSLGLETIKTDIILDGGNVVKKRGIAIMTDKVLLENRHQYTKAELKRELQRLLEVDKLVLINWDKTDLYGHSDGIVRFIDDRTVLLSDFYADNPGITGPLKAAGLNYEALTFNKKRPSKKRWIYINFLQTPAIFLLPKLNIPEDDLALEKMQYYFPGYASQDRIQQVDCTSIVYRGGGLNCVSWDTNIDLSKPPSVNQQDTPK